MAKRKSLTLEDIYVLPPGSGKTFSHDSKLPSLPVPLLSHTLERYIESLEPFLNADELAASKALVQSFANGIGQKLQQKLLHKAANNKNWVEKWWEDLAYLSVRLPLIPHCSMMGIGMEEAINTLQFPNDQLKVASVYMYHLTKVWLLLRKERMRPTQGGDNSIFSMTQFRRLYNTVRVPGERIDTLQSYFKTEFEGPCPDHVVVMCKGRLFSMSALNESGDALCPADWEEQLRQVEVACHQHEGPGVGVLTCDERTRWAKNRKYLKTISQGNINALHTIDTAMCILVLDQEEAITQTEVGLKSLAGDYSNRWADKSIAVHSYKNGFIGGLCEHTAFDGMISMTSMHYNFMAIKESSLPQTRAKALQPPSEIHFHLDQLMRGEILLAKSQLENNKSQILLVCEKFIGYGKQMIQMYRIHPDSYIQMALQLAYYKLHHKPAPTYETATTRAFYNGRTETVRSCTVEAVKWVKAMTNPHSSDSEKKGLLRSAVEKHDVLMKEARENAGCDRHLFGLQCIAAEEGIETPSLFTDPAYSRSGGGGNFVLSTSLVGYTPLLGGVAPMCRDGYGCFYNICSNSLHFSISVWRASPETSASKFYTYLEQSLNEMRELLGPLPSRL